MGSPDFVWCLLLQRQMFLLLYATSTSVGSWGGCDPWGKGAPILCVQRRAIQQHVSLTPQTCCTGWTANYPGKLIVIFFILFWDSSSSDQAQIIQFKKSCMPTVLGFCSILSICPSLVSFFRKSVSKENAASKLKSGNFWCFQSFSPFWTKFLKLAKFSLTFSHPNFIFFLADE